MKAVQKEPERLWRKEFDAVTSDGKLLQVLTAVMENAWLLNAESRVSGTTSDEVDEECRRCRPGSPLTR